MHNVVPRLISDEIHRCGHVSGGSLEAPALHLDIASFTSITEDLMRKGKRGAEELSILINRIYEPLIAAIYARGGFITTFAGDAVTAVFPGDSGRAAMASAEQIMEDFSRRQGLYGRYSGGREMKVRIGLADGETEWRVYGGERKAFCFYGPAIEECAQVTKGREAGRIFTAKSFFRQEGASGGSSRPVGRVRPTIARRFYPEAVLRARPGGEFRSVTAMFLGLRRGEMADADSAVTLILEKTAEYGGYFNGMFFDDKGPHVLVVFGAPVSYENNADRALSLAWELRDAFGKGLRTGITTGTAFAGVVGSSRRCTYTVLGDCVNSAARIMENAGWGSVCLPESLRDGFSRRLVSGEPSELSLKGKRLPLSIVEVEDVTDMPEGMGFRGALVGRSRETAELEGCLEPLAEGRFAGVTYVCGEAGVGKSRLLSDVVAGLPRCQSFAMQTDGILKKSLNPFTHLLKEYFGQSDGSSKEDGEAAFGERWDRLMAVLSGLPDRQAAEPVMRELQRTRSLLAAMLGYHSEASLHRQLDARGRFDNTLLALKAFFKAQSLIAPTIFLLEDLQWLDEDSMTALGVITRNVESFPFAIAASSRFGDDGSRPELELDDTVAVNRMTLKPLEGREVLDLAEARLSRQLSEELASFIMDRTQGNPFYIEQFCMYLDENSLLRERSGRLHLCGDQPDIPEGIGSVIVARIDRLSARLKELVQTAAVLGREFNVRVLSEMLRGGRAEVHPLLDEGEREAIWSALSEILYIFSHTMLREVAYDMQLRRQLRELHGLAARSMEELYGDDSGRYAEIAYHYERALIGGKAAEFLRRAADFALSEYRNQEAVGLLGRLASHRDTQEGRLETELEMVSPLVIMGKWSDAEEIIERTRNAALDSSLDGICADCNRHHAALEHRRGNNEEAFRHLEAAWEHYAGVGDERGMAQSRSIRASLNMVRGSFEQAREDLEACIAAAEAGGDLVSLARNITDLATVYIYQYKLDEAERSLRRAREICAETDNMRVDANAVNNLGVVEYYRRNYGRCREYMDEYLSIAESVGDRESMTYVLGNMGVLQHQKGDSKEAMASFRRQLAMAQELGVTYCIAFARLQIGIVHWDRGAFSTAIDWMKQSLEAARAAGDSRSSAQATRDIGKVYFEMGDLVKAREYLESAEALSAGVDKDVHSNTLLFLARLAAKEGRRDEAAEHVESLIAQRREIGEDRVLMEYLIDSGGIMLSGGCEERAGKMLEEAREIAGRVDAGDLTDSLELQESLFQALSDGPGAERRLLELLEEHSQGDEFSARIHFHLYRITGEERYRQSAIGLYTELYGNVPKNDYSEKLVVLRKG